MAENGLKKLDVFDQLSKTLEELEIFASKGSNLVLSQEADQYAYLVIKALERLTTLKDEMKSKMQEDLKKQPEGLTSVAGEKVKFYIKDGYERVVVDRQYVNDYWQKHKKYPDGVSVVKVKGNAVISLAKE